MLTANPRMNALKANAITLWASTVLRIGVLAVDTSAVWQAAAMVNEKYAKSQNTGRPVCGNSNGRSSSLAL